MSNVKSKLSMFIDRLLPPASRFKAQWIVGRISYLLLPTCAVIGGLLIGLRVISGHSLTTVDSTLLFAALSAAQLIKRASIEYSHECCHQAWALEKAVILESLDNEINIAKSIEAACKQQRLTTEAIDAILIGIKKKGESAVDATRRMVKDAFTGFAPETPFDLDRMSEGGATGSPSFEDGDDNRQFPARRGNDVN